MWVGRRRPNLADLGGHWLGFAQSRLILVESEQSFAQINRMWLESGGRHFEIARTLLLRGMSKHLSGNREASIMQAVRWRGIWRACCFRQPPC